MLESHLRMHVERRKEQGAEEGGDVSYLNWERSKLVASVKELPALSIPSIAADLDSGISYRRFRVDHHHQINFASVASHACLLRHGAHPWQDAVWTSLRRKRDASHV